MLTGPLVRVNFYRNRVIAQFIDATLPQHIKLADELLGVVTASVGRTRAEVDQQIEERWGDEPGNFLLRGLAKIVGDNCEFAGVDEPPPALVRESLFRKAALLRVEGRFDREAVIHEVANETGISVQTLEDQLFADLKGEQRLVSVSPLTGERLLARYNVGLAQGILLKAVAVRLTIRGESPSRIRRMFTQIKFRRLLCEVTSGAAGEWLFRLDGPLSLFTATQKYGVQLAMFLPSVLHCNDFELDADLLWGAGKTPKSFQVSSRDRLSSDRAESGSYVPPEIAMFAELFRKKVRDWQLEDVAEIVSVDGLHWIPDFRLTHRSSGKSVGLEILGAWRKSGIRSHLEKLSNLPSGSYLVALSQSHAVESDDIDGLTGVLQFRQFPPPDDVAKRAAQLLGLR